MKLKDQIPDHRFDRSLTRLDMSDSMNEKKKIDFLINITNEHFENYRRLGVPEKDIESVISMPTRIREFFGWKKGLEIVSLYRKGDRDGFMNLLNDYFENTEKMGSFTGYDIEMMLDTLGMSKSIAKTDSIIEKVKVKWQSLQVNSDGLSDIRHWIGRNSAHFYELGYHQMTGAEVLSEFARVEENWLKFLKETPQNKY